MSVTIGQEEYATYGKCRKLSNGTVDVFVTTDIGPRVICYRLSGEKNIFAEIGPDGVVSTEDGDWYLRGGHRLWHAPEVKPRSYQPDNNPVLSVEATGNSVCALAPVEKNTGIQKQITVKLDEQGSGVEVTHKLTNQGRWAIEVAPWALSIMRGGGVTVFPQEPFISHNDFLLPARPLVLWHFTDMSDPRWTFGKKYVQLRTDATRDFAQKIGAGIKQGWAGYLESGTLFVKHFPFVEGAKYADMGCNFETFTKGEFMEVETLGPLTVLEPGESTTHVEKWQLFGGVDAGSTEESLDAAISPLVARKL